MTRKFLHFMCDHEWNGWIGRQLPGDAHALELVDIQVTPVPWIMTDFPFVYDLWFRQFLASAQAAGVLSTTEVAAWVADQEARQRAGRCFVCWALFLVFARKPEGNL